MQRLLIDSENCSVSLNASPVVTREGRHGTSAISFLGALRIPVSTCAILACFSKNWVLPQNPYYHEVLDGVVDDINFASQASIGISGVYRLQQILVHRTRCALLRGGVKNQDKSTLFSSKQMA